MSRRIRRQSSRPSIPGMDTSVITTSGLRFTRLFFTLGPILRGRDLVAGLLEEAAERHADVVVVIHNEHSQGGLERRRGPVLYRLAASSAASAPGISIVKRAPSPRREVRTISPPCLSTICWLRPQAQARAALPLRREERVEDLRLDVFGDPRDRRLRRAAVRGRPRRALRSGSRHHRQGRPGRS